MESTAGALAGQWHGQAGQSAQAALIRFREAATAQVNQLNDISGNIHTAGIQYTLTDEEQAHSLATSMDASMGPVDSSPTNGAMAQTGNAQTPPRLLGGRSGAGQTDGAVGLDHTVAGSATDSPDDQIVGPAASGPRIVMVDDHNGPPAPAPSPPQTGEPIKLPQRPNLPQVIDANIDPGQPAASAPGPSSSCDAGDVLTHLAEIVGGGVSAGAAVPAEIPSMGASTALFIAGAAGVVAGANGLRDCAK